MKGLFKGLRYISQIIENEKEAEMQIGTPTDVKHVAHIGWDGGSANQNSSPTWMNDIRSLGGHSSVPLGNFLEDGSFISEDSTRSRDTPGLPKPSRDRSPTKERSRRGHANPKSSRRSSKESCDIPSSDGSRRSRRKKSKDSVNGGSSRSSRRSRDSDSMSDAGSVISSVSNDT